MTTRAAAKGTSAATVKPSLDNPFAEVPARREGTLPPYDQALHDGEELRRRPYTAAGTVQTLRQHARSRMTVWERIDALQDKDAQPTVLWQNWGKNLDGASIVTLVTTINGRDVAIYGHDFTVRAGSMDATNGRKLANLITVTILCST